MFEDELYLGTNTLGVTSDGGSVYRTADGDNWTELVGENGGYDSGGFNEEINWGIHSFETYQGSLFVGTANYLYYNQADNNVIGAQVFEFLGDPEPGTPDYLF